MLGTSKWPLKALACKATLVTRAFVIIGCREHSKGWCFLLIFYHETDLIRQRRLYRESSASAPRGLETHDAPQGDTLHTEIAPWRESEPIFGAMFGDFVCSIVVPKGGWCLLPARTAEGFRFLTWSAKSLNNKTATHCRLFETCPY